MDHNDSLSKFSSGSFVWLIKDVEGNIQDQIKCKLLYS